MRTTTFRAAFAGVLVLSLAAAGCSAQDDGDVTHLDFFQFKGEATADFDAIIEGFEAENPDIDVVQNQVADSETALRTLLVKNRPPDVMTLGGNGSNGQLAAAGVFHDFSEDPVLDTITPAVQDLIGNLGHVEGEVNFLAYVTNANGIIYNRAIFAEQGLEVPRTWDELIAVCDALQAAGVTPFASSAADAWTLSPSFNGIGAYATKDGFFDALREQGGDVGPESEVSFEKNLSGTIDLQHQLFDYSQDGYRGSTYDDATALFANGGAAMIMQGNWAMSPVRTINPDIDAAIFPYPSPVDPSENILVSGVDIAVTLPVDGPKNAEAMRFIEYMFRPDVVSTFAAAQSVVPAVADAEPADDSVIQSIAPVIEAGQVTGFIDHNVPPSVPLNNFIQQAMFDRDAGPAMRALDREWAKVAARTIPVVVEEDE